jgi:hypothetical protein
MFQSKRKFPYHFNAHPLLPEEHCKANAHVCLTLNHSVYLYEQFTLKPLHRKWKTAAVRTNSKATSLSLSQNYSHLHVNS